MKTTAKSSERSIQNAVLAMLPGEFAGEPDLGLRRIEDHGEAKAEANTIVARFAEDGLPHAGEVSPVGRCRPMRSTVFRPRSRTPSNAVAQDDLAEACVIYRSGDEPAASGEKGRVLSVGAVLHAVLPSKTPRARVFIAGGEPIELPRGH